MSKEYPHFKLDDINLELPTGSIMGFIGANGAGKSTTIRLLMGLAKTIGRREIVFGAMTVALMAIGYAGV